MFLHPGKNLIADLGASQGRPCMRCRVRSGPSNGSEIISLLVTRQMQLLQPQEITAPNLSKSNDGPLRSSVPLYVLYVGPLSRRVVGPGLCTVQLPPSTQPNVDGPVSCPKSHVDHTRFPEWGGASLCPAQKV